TGTARYTVTDLGALGTGDFSVATAVNNAGQVVGYSNPTATTTHAFRWSNGTLTDLGTNPGGGFSRANAINNAGQVAGTADRIPGGFGYPVRWSAGNVITDLGGPVTNALGVANAVNVAGQIVGTADPQCVPCPAPRAWLWQAGTMTALDTLIPAGSGWTLQQANGINDRGQIVGAGVHNGHMRAYLLTPVFSATVNFQPAGAPRPVGYLADTGAAFGPRSGGRTYGWNVDNSANARDRNASGSADQRYDTLNHLQKPGGAR